MSRAGRLLRRGGAWLVATALLVACFRGVDWGGALDAAAGAHPGWLLGALALDLSLVALWAAQWRIFLPRSQPVPFPRVLRITAVMAMTANSLPYLAGHATGVHLLATRGGVGHATALSVLTLDQLTEGLAKVALLLSLALLAPLPEPLRAALLLLAPGVGLLLVLTLLGASRPQRLARWTGRLRQGSLSALSGFLARWSRGLEAARRPRMLAAGLALALAMKGVEAAGMIAVQSALGVELPLHATLVVLAAVSLATMLPLAPANLGVYEGAALLAYRWAGVSPETALALALLQHLAYLAAMGGAGWAAVTVRGAPQAGSVADAVGS